jgi:4-diphosphocytidyl-2-C-methyl-D-erythritol kinase
VIARPASGLSTAEVYRHCKPSEAPRRVETLVQNLQEGRLDTAGRLFHNALQAPAEELNPEVRTLKAQFSQEPVLGHRMSGSGTAWFALCSHRLQARAVAARLAAQGVPYTAVVQTRP